MKPYINCWIITLLRSESIVLFLVFSFTFLPYKQELTEKYELLIFIFIINQIARTIKSCFYISTFFKDPKY